MAIQPKYADVEVVLADSRGHLRTDMKTALTHAGFFQVRHTGATKNVAESVENMLGPDILICDMSLEEGAVRNIVTSIRQNDLGRNPFLCVIGVTWNPTTEEVTRVINSGVDHLLSAPVSPEQILIRIRALIRARAPFVVTTDYIGPDRRKNARAPSRIPVFEVPNTLREKATGNWNFGDMEKLLREAVGDLNNRRIDVQAQNIMNLAGKIAQEAAKSRTEGLQPQIERLDKMVRAMERCAAERGLVHIAELCNACVKVVDEIWEKGAMDAPKDLALLNHLGRAIRTALFPENSKDVAHSIAEIVANAR
jgi:DNA-binding response OmpR family regulator